MNSKTNPNLNIEIVKNELKNEYVVNYNIWTIDETILSNHYAVFIVINIKTRAVIGFAVKRFNSNNPQTEIVNKNNNTRYKVCLNADEILDVYQVLFEAGCLCEMIHSDNNPVYFSPKIKKLLKEKDIKISATNDYKHSNQVSESFNNQLKNLLITHIHQESNNTYKYFRKSWPDKFKHVTIKNKLRNKEFRQMFFNSEFFNSKVDVISQVRKAIQFYNNQAHKQFNTKKTRFETEQLSSQIVPLCLAKAKSKTSNSINIIKENNQTYELTDNLNKHINNDSNLDDVQRNNIKNTLLVAQPPIALNEHLTQLYDSAPPEQKAILETIILTYKSQLDTTKRVENLNYQLLDRIKGLEQENNQYHRIINELKDYQDKIQQEVQIKHQTRLKRLNRKRRDKTQPLMFEDLNLLFKEIDNGSITYRTRLTLKTLFVLFAVTGCRVSEIQHITVDQVFNALYKSFIKIDRVKRGPSNHKAFFTKLNKKIINDNRESFINLLKANNISIPTKPLTNYSVEPYTNLYFFSSEKSRGKKVYARAYFTNLVNKFLQNCTCFIKEGKHFTSHSLRHGFIEQLYKDTSDIRFVQTAIGHCNVETTSGYLQVNENQLKERIESI